MTDYGALWSNRSFRALWIGTLSVRLGSQIGVIALTWLVLKATGSGTKIGIALSLYAVGDMVASPLVGVLLDRLPRKLLLNLDNVLQAIIFITMAILYIFHHLPFVALLVLVVCSGALSPLAYLGRMIILPNVVTGEQWESANTAMQLNMNLVTLLGPAVGGILVAAIGVSSTLVLTAITFAIYFATLWLIPANQFQQEHLQQRSGFITEIMVGWRFMRTVPLLLLMVIVTLFFSLTYGPLEPALPVLVKSVFHQGPETLGFLWSGFAVGALLGTVLWGRFRPQWGLRWMISGVILLWGVFSGAVGLTHHVWMAMGLLALGGLTYAPYNILYSVWRQRLVPDAIRGKVFGSINSVTGLGLPMGQAIGGFLIGSMGAQRTVEIGGLACVILGVTVFLSKSVWHYSLSQTESSNISL